MRWKPSPPRLMRKQERGIREQRSEIEKLFPWRERSLQTERTDQISETREFKTCRAIAPPRAFYSLISGL